MVSSEQEEMNRIKLRILFTIDHSQFTKQTTG